MSARLEFSGSGSLKSVAGTLAVLGVILFALWASHAASADEGTSCPSGFGVVLPVRNIVIDPGARQADLGMTLCNGTAQVQRADIVLEGAPDTWRVFVKPPLGNYRVTSVSLPARSSQELTIRMTGFESSAPGTVPMTLRLNTLDGVVSDEVEIIAEFLPSGEPDASGEEERDISMTPTYPTLEGPASDTFHFDVLIKNGTGEADSFELTSEAPPGWTVVFADIFEPSKLISSLSLENLRFKKIRVKADAPRNAEAGSYPIVVMASTEDVTGQVPLRADVTGSFDMVVSTPDRRLNLGVAAGKPSPGVLTVSNTGNAELRDVSLLADPPIDWEIDFDVDTIDQLASGDSANVPFTITPRRDAIPGDYTVIIRANSPDVLDSVEMTVSVSQSTMWRWLGIALVVIVVAGLVGLYVRLGGAWSRT